MAITYGVPYHKGPRAMVAGVASKQGKRNIGNASPNQLQYRAAVMDLVRECGVKYIKMYSNMAGGKLRVKLYDCYRIEDGAMRSLNQTQLSTLTANGFVRQHGYSTVASYTLYINP